MINQKKLTIVLMGNNHYEEVVNKMREKYLKDKEHVYT